MLRGDVVPEGKYAGRRVYNAGINLTHLYYGKIPFLWFLVRDLGFVNKMYRGLARPDVSPDEVAGDSIEKLWISAVETFAIGGGCQILLATDFNIAGRDAYMTLPARKEGIIPAMANLRLAALRRRSHHPPGDHVRAPHRLRFRRRPHDLRRGRGPQADMDAAIVRVIDRLHRIRRRGRDRQPPRAAPLRRATRHLPPLRRALCPRAGLPAISARR